MNKMKDFKNIADDIMRDIKVNEELKQKTLIKCANKKNISISKLLIPAACFILILGIINIYHILKLENQENQDEGFKNNIMMNGEYSESIPESFGNNILSTKEEKKWAIGTLDDAKIDFGRSFIIPTYIPQDYKLDQINASGFEEEKASKIVISNFSRDQSFIIIQEKTQIESEFDNYEKVDINGTIGLLKSNASIDMENEDSINTELHWSKNEIQYSIIGLITKEEAIKIARSMK